MNCLKFALPVAALLSACNPGATAETGAVSPAAPNVPAEQSAPAVPPAAESAVAPSQEETASAAAETAPAAKAAPAAKEESAADVPAGFAVTKVVPEDFSPAAFNIFTTGAMRFRVEFFASDVFRIQAAPDGAFADPLNDPTAAQILVDDLPVCRERVDCEITPEKIVWRTAALVLSMDKATGAFALSRADGTPIFAETKPLAFADGTVTQTLSTGDDEFYYGGGQQNGHFSHKGTKIEISANGWNENDRPNPAPFFRARA